MRTSCNIYNIVKNGSSYTLKLGIFLKYIFLRNLLNKETSNPDEKYKRSYKKHPYFHIGASCLKTGTAKIPQINPTLYSGPRKSLCYKKKKKNPLEAQWAEPVSLTFHSALRKFNTEPSIGASRQISVHFGKPVSDKKIFRN